MSLGAEHDIIIVGAGILGLSSAYHILLRQPVNDLVVLDRLGGPGRGNTTKSAAAFRDMFTTPSNRRLSQGSIRFYEEVQGSRSNLGLRRIGYLWLMTSDQVRSNREALNYFNDVGVVFDLLETNELKNKLPGLVIEDIDKGVFGSNCGILNQNRISVFYEQGVKKLGGKVLYDTEVTGLSKDDMGEIDGVVVDGKVIKGRTVIVATGAWMKETLATVDIDVPIVTKKRQLFSIKARSEHLKRLLNVKAFNSHFLLPFTIFPDGAYLRPAANSLIVGYADRDREPGLEEGPKAEMDFFEERVRPQIERYFPAFKDIRADLGWAGHYAYHLPDNTPFVARMDGAIVVGGASGSGIMKADSLGRVVEGLYRDRKEVTIGDGTFFKVAELGLKGRDLPEEEFVI